MNLNDLNEAPMGILNKLGQKIISKVPGSIGHTAQGKLNVGTVANTWKKEYMTYLGSIGQKPSTENLTAFLQTRKKLTPDELSSFMGESARLYERSLTSKEVDGLILKAAQKAAAGIGGGTMPRVEPTIGAPGGSANKTPGRVEPTLGTSASAPASTPAPAAAASPAANVPAITTRPAADPKNLKTDAAGGYIRKWVNDLMNTKDQKQKIALAKEMINFLTDRKGTPEGSRLASAVAALAAKSKDPVLSKMVKAVRTLRMERTNYIIANQILSEIGLTWKDLDMRILISESTIDYVIIACR
jgi:hypothetical protein